MTAVFFHHITGEILFHLARKHVFFEVTCSAYTAHLMVWAMQAEAPKKRGNNKLSNEKELGI